MEKLSKRACVNPLCGSSDALQPYENESGKITGFCFSCQTYFRNLEQKENTHSYTFKFNQNHLTKEDVLSFPTRLENDRGICFEINERFGIKSSFNEKTGEPDCVYYPYHINKKLSGYKGRKLPKDFDMPSIGSIKNADLFGKHLCSDSNKTLIITEGEEDMLSICQVLWKYFNKKKFPNIVSLKNGAGVGKSLEKELDFINSHDKIILSMDNDEAGIAAQKEISLKIDYNKLFTMNLSEKDANDCLLKGKEKEIVDSFLNPVPYQPNGIIYVSDLKDVFYDDAQVDSVKYPPEWVQFNNSTYGMRIGELDTFTSGTSNGKTQIFRELIAHMLLNTNQKIGAIFLEENLKDTLNGLAGVLLNKRMHLPDVRNKMSNKEIDKGWEILSREKRLVFHDNRWESTHNNTILSTIKFMAEYSKCKFIFLDHLSILISEDSEKGRERERIDSLMTKLKSLTQKLQVWIGLIVHLRKSENKSLPFERGAIPSEDDLRGSAAIKQLSNGVYAIQRNRTHSNPNMRNIIRLHVLKQRFTGVCGPMDFLNYDSETGRMLVMGLPEDDIIEANPVRKSFNIKDDF